MTSDYFTLAMDDVFRLGGVGISILAGVWLLAYRGGDNKVCLRHPGTPVWLVPTFVKAGVLCLLVPTIANIVWPWVEEIYFSLQLPVPNIIYYTFSMLFALTLVLISARLVLRVVYQVIRTQPSLPVSLQMLSDYHEDEESDDDEGWLV